MVKDYLYALMTPTSYEKRKGIYEEIATALESEHSVFMPLSTKALETLCLKQAIGEMKVLNKFDVEFVEEENLLKLRRKVDKETA